MRCWNIPSVLSDLQLNQVNSLDIFFPNHTGHFVKEVTPVTSSIQASLSYIDRKLFRQFSLSFWLQLGIQKAKLSHLWEFWNGSNNPSLFHASCVSHTYHPLQFKGLVPFVPDKGLYQKTARLWYLSNMTSQTSLLWQIPVSGEEYWNHWLMKLELLISCILRLPHLLSHLKWDPHQCILEEKKNG